MNIIFSTCYPRQAGKGKLEFLSRLVPNYPKLDQTSFRIVNKVEVMSFCLYLFDEVVLLIRLGSVLQISHLEEDYPHGSIQTHGKYIFSSKSIGVMELYCTLV